MLTDKAMRDFNKWLFENQKLYAYNVLGNDIISSAVIVHWFDSVGIYIQHWATRNDRKALGFDADILFNGEYFSLDGFTKTRQEAIQSAIQKANELYNTTHP